MTKYYHGTNNPESIINMIIGNSTLNNTFHMTPDIAVAKNYGNTVLVIELESDLHFAHIGVINKEGNHNSNVGHGIEVVLKTPQAFNEFYKNIVDCYPM